LLPETVRESGAAGQSVKLSSQCRMLSYDPYARPCAIILTQNFPKKIAADFFRVIFLFYKCSGHFFFTKWPVLFAALYSFHLTRFY
jgi:hypothetical protein